MKCFVYYNIFPSTKANICFILLFLLRSPLAVDVSIASNQKGCEVYIKKDLTYPEPLLLFQNEAKNAIKAFPFPVRANGILTFKQGETIDLACPGGSIVDKGSHKRFRSSVVHAECRSGIYFMVKCKEVPISAITCSKDPRHIARYNGYKCGFKYREIEIGFIVNNRFINHITTCFDDTLLHVLYSKADLTSGIIGKQINYSRPNFIPGKFFDETDISVQVLYTRKVQRTTINKILGLKKCSRSVIKDNDFYLARGHYIANADFVYRFQQRLTFYYVNVAPQWQTFNNGNWKRMEMNCRKLANKKKRNFVIYTGSHGISRLPDVNGRLQELYLWVTKDNKKGGIKKGIPVPAFFYRVVYEPISKAGIVLIGLNNPYNKNIADEIICTDVCRKIKWLTWKPNNITRGYSYCCEVDDFRQVVSVLPPLDVKSLLK